MARKVTILCAAPWPLEESDLAPVRAVSPDVAVQTAVCADGHEVARTLGDAEVLYTQDPPATLAQAPNLQWIQFRTASVDRLRGTPVAESSLLLTNVSGVNARHSAEYVFMSILAWAGKLPLIHQYRQRRVWPDVPTRVHQMARQPLRGATIGIVGYGSIGRAVARLAAGFGMRVLAAKRSPQERRDFGYTYPGAGDPEGRIPERIYGPAAVPEMVAACDFVVLCLPATPETDQWIGETVLRAMPRHAYLVNVGRGTVIDEPVLIRALQEGWIGGAGLDVFAQEPLSPDNPLWDLPNVIWTPHVSNNAPDYERDSLAFFAQNLQRYLTGEPLLNVVDPIRGY